MADKGRKKNHNLSVSTQQARNVYTLGPFGKTGPSSRQETSARASKNSELSLPGPGARRKGRLALVVPGQVRPRTEKGGQAGQEGRGDPSGRESRAREGRASPRRRAGGRSPSEQASRGRGWPPKAGPDKPASGRETATTPQALPRRESGRRHARPAGHSDSYHLRVSPWTFRRDLPRAAAGQTHAKGPKVEFSREHNLPPTPHTTRLTVSRDLKSGSAQGSRLPPRGIRVQVHKFSCAPGQSLCQFNRYG